MNIEEFLQRLAAAKSEAERDAFSLQFTLESLPEELRTALWAAAIPHWFDAPFLAALLDCSLAEAQQRYGELIALSYVEPFAERGHNIHERTRNLLLAHLWQDDPARYRELSRRAALYCSTGRRSMGLGTSGI